MIDLYIPDLILLLSLLLCTDTSTANIYTATIASVVPKGGKLTDYWFWHLMGGFWRAVWFVTSDYFNYEEGTITRHLLKLGWKPIRDRFNAKI